jgi:signal transduction histidine kinase
MPKKDNLNRLRSELIEILERPDIDYGQVVDLSSKIARLDPENVRFSVDAGLINRLGRELVAREETAVSELVKNTYDADATQVELTFENTNLPGGTLTIDDNGNGMSREELINGFMRLSSTDKIEHPISPRFKRRRAGRKGIGRFAAQRLGSRLIITTQTEAAKKALRVEIDWERFEDNLDLTNIASRVEEVEKAKEYGTTLVIEDLTDHWPETSITRVYRYLADLIQPFPLSKQHKKSKLDLGFDIDIFRIANGEIKVVASVEEMVYKHALAEIEGVVDRKGSGAWSIKSDRFNINEDAIEIGAERDNSKAPFKYLRDIHFKAYYYIYNAGFIPPTQNKLILEMARERGGIRVYRNGFRVLPYGEPFNDWLRLDYSYSQRHFLPPHANQNFFGFVEITDPEGNLFQETSSREGLLENEAFAELVNFIYRVLTNVALKIAEERARKKTASQKNWNKQNKSPIEQLKDTTQNLYQIADGIENNLPKDGSDVSPEQAQRLARGVREAIRELEETATQQEVENALRIEERGMLRVLAGLGLSIGEFTHEIRHRFPPIMGDATYLRNIHKKGKPQEVSERLINHLNTLKAYTAYFDEAVSENARREMAIQELGVVIRNFTEVIRPAADRYAITVHEPKIWGYDLFTCPMHPSEWVSILFNLFTNSQKAIRRAGRKGEILLRAGRADNNVYLQFSDNGDGIAPEIADRIFDAFFTTTSPASPLAGEREEATGTGLGLKIISDIVTGYNGDIELVTPPKGYSTSFKIEIPRASDEEIEKYGY